jgi:hypothetical protein
MRGRTSAFKIEMDTQTRKTLLSWLRRQKTPAGLAKRARAMLLLADGQTYSHTSKQVGLSERHLRKWAKRYLWLSPSRSTRCYFCQIHSRDFITVHSLINS